MDTISQNILSNISENMKEVTRGTFSDYYYRMTNGMLLKDMRYAVLIEDWDIQPRKYFAVSYNDFLVAVMRAVSDLYEDEDNASLAWCIDTLYVSDRNKSSDVGSFLLNELAIRLRTKYNCPVLIRTKDSTVRELLLQEPVWRTYSDDRLCHVMPLTAIQHTKGIPNF